MQDPHAHELAVGRGVCFEKDFVKRGVKTTL